MYMHLRCQGSSKILMFMTYIYVNGVQNGTRMTYISTSVACKMNFHWHTKGTKFDIYIRHWHTKEHLCGMQRVKS